MKEKIFDDNIFFITNKLEDYTSKFKAKCENFNFYGLSYEEFPEGVEKVKKIGKIENNIVVISKQFFNDKIHKKIKKIFSTKFKIPNPHFLFISSKDWPIEEQNKIINQQNFFYQLSDVKQKESAALTFYYFMMLIFQHMQDLSRLNEYIITSFQTIVDSEIINQQKVKIEKLYEELECLSKIDVLTNVLNRRALFEALETEKSRTLRDKWRITSEQQENEDVPDPERSDGDRRNFINKKPMGSIYDHLGRFSCLMIDIDHFKRINDTYGHLVGDHVLQQIGDLLNSEYLFRDNDFIGRYGGEEFVAILPETNSTHAKIPAERLRDLIKKINFSGGEKTFHVSVSIGISEFRLEDKTSDEIINRADKALYYAKQHGRDQTVVYEEAFDK